MQPLRKPVVGYEGLYEVNELGEVFALSKIVQRTGRDKKEHFFSRQERKITHKKRCEYPAVCLYKNKQKKFHSIHRIVAEAFIPNPNNLPQVNHKDENKWNTNLNNLEWCSIQDNQIHSKSKPIFFMSPWGDVIKVIGLNRFCKEFKLNKSCINRLFSHKQHQHKGWRIIFNH